MRDDKKKMNDNTPGIPKRDVPNENYEHTQRSAQTGNQGRASYHTGSTTQGGSNFGQGSHQLGGESYHQGDVANRGSNYDNEAGRFSEDKGDESSKTNVGNERGQLKENRTDVPHGQGAHVNEKESNAQEDYPGIMDDEPEKDII